MQAGVRNKLFCDCAISFIASMFRTRN